MAKWNVIMRVLIGINENSNPYGNDQREVIAVSYSEEVLKKHVEKCYDESLFTDYEIVEVPFLEES